MPITLVSVTDFVGLSGSLIGAVENDMNYGRKAGASTITGAAPFRVSLTLVDAADFGSGGALGLAGGFVANGQTIDGHALYISDSLYGLRTGDVTGLAGYVAIM